MFEMDITSESQTPSQCCLEYCYDESSCSAWRDDGIHCNGKGAMDWSSWVKPREASAAPNPPLLEDFCGGLRESTCGGIYYAVMGTGIWEPDYDYQCPPGYVWITTTEFTQQQGESTTCKQEFTYHDKCGWNGYTWGGVERNYFRFEDSDMNNGWGLHVGTYDDQPPNQPKVTTAFAGIICAQESPVTYELVATGTCVSDYTTEGSDFTYQECADRCTEIGCKYFTRPASVGENADANCWTTIVGHMTGTCNEAIYAKETQQYESSLLFDVFANSPVAMVFALLGSLSILFSISQFLKNQKKDYISIEMDAEEI